MKWDDPATFTEIRQSTNRFEAERGNWVQQLASYVQTTAARPLQRADPGRDPGRHQARGRLRALARPARQRHPDHARHLSPRITLQYTLKDASGRIVDEGEAKLSDTGYLHNLGLKSDSDPLRYEKRLIDDWVKRELSTRATAAR